MISVIVPAWGDTPFLARAIASVGSDPLTEVIVAAPPVGGAETTIAARMEALKQASGDWVLFLDADDCLAEQAITKLRSLHLDDVDIVCGALARVSKSGKRTIKHYSNLGPCDVYNSLSAKLIRRTLFERVKIDYSVRNGEDLMVVEQLLAAGRSVKVIDEVLYEYIENTKSTTHLQTNESKALDLLKVDALLLDVLDSNQFATMHNRIIRDALLLLIKAGKVGSPIWDSTIARLTEPISADDRHGFVKRFALIIADLIGKVV